MSTVVYHLMLTKRTEMTLKTNNKAHRSNVQVNQEDRKTVDKMSCFLADQDSSSRWNNIHQVDNPCIDQVIMAKVRVKTCSWYHFHLDCIVTPEFNLQVFNRRANTVSTTSR